MHYSSIDAPPYRFKLQHTPDHQHVLPTLTELGHDLLQITPQQRIVTLGLPFVSVVLYVVFATLGHWLLAVMALIYLSFVTYGSISHDDDIERAAAKMSFVRTLLEGTVQQGRIYAWAFCGGPNVSVCESCWKGLHAPPLLQLPSCCYQSQ